jgi:hypothetical protein
VTSRGIACPEASRDRSQPWRDPGSPLFRSVAAQAPILDRARRPLRPAMRSCPSPGSSCSVSCSMVGRPSRQRRGPATLPWR